MKKSRKNLPAAEASKKAGSAPAPAKIPAAAPAIRQIEWRRHLLILAGLWIAALAVYSNSFQTGMPFDNTVAIQGDPRVHEFTSANLQLIVDKEYWFPSLTTGLYRPLTTFSYLFNYAVLGNGDHPFGYHAVNYLLQAGNITLVYLLSLILLEDTSWAWLLAAVWTLHPLLTESITNIVGRADQLAAMGVFAGLLCHIEACRTTGKRRWIWLAGVTASAAVAIFSKESGIVILGGFLCYDLTYGRESAWKTRLAGYAATLPALAVFFYLRGQMLATGGVLMTPMVDNPLVAGSEPAATLTAFKVIGKYLALYLWPLRLSNDYSYNQIPVVVDAGGLVSLAICLAAAWLAFRAWRGGRNPVAFAILFFFVTLAPTSNLLIHVGSIMAERWMYLPSFGLALLAVWGLSALTRRFPALPKQALVAAALLVCAAWGVRAFARNFDWRDELTIWQKAQDITRESYKPPSAISNVLATMAHPQLDRAIEESERSLAILGPLPDSESIPRPWAVAGMCYRLKGDSLGDPRLGAPWYRKALDRLLRARTIDQAGVEQLNIISASHRGGQVRSGLALMYLELGRVQRRLSMWQDAIESLDHGRLLSPMPEFSEEKSQVFEDMGNNQQAAVALLEGMMIDPRSQRLSTRVVHLYKRTAGDTCAIQPNGSASSFDPKCPLVHDEICNASRNIFVAERDWGKTELAIQVARRAVLGLGCSTNMFE